MLAIVVAFVVALVITLLLVRRAQVVGGSALDVDTAGPQKFHSTPVPRVGGIGIVAGIGLAVAAVSWRAPRTGEMGALLLACGIPVFAGGLIEDLTKRVTPLQRLLLTAVSAALAAWVLDAALVRTTIPGLDWLVSFAAGSIVATVFAVAGVANAINIIDGFNGLASMCVAIMLAALAYVAHQVGDPVVGVLALAGIGAVFGFFLWNFPAGLIFLGDGGAYFLGFWFAELAVLLLVRNPTVSPLFPLLVCIYPVVETLFSIYRRRVLRAMPPSMPDGIHLHSLIYRRMMRWAVGPDNARALSRRNSMTSPFLWLLCMGSAAPAMLFWDQTPWMVAFLLLFSLSYIALYWRIVRFKSPRWMRALAARQLNSQMDDVRERR